MTQEQLQHAATRLLMTPGIVGEDMYLPKVYIVAGKCYWFLNVARRAAYMTRHNIFVLTIEKAWQIAGRKGSPDRHHIAKEFDQTGDTYDGKLFDEKGSIFANAVINEIITL